MDKSSDCLVAKGTGMVDGVCLVRMCFRFLVLISVWRSLFVEGGSLMN